jgi:hypothetical protein
MTAWHLSLTEAIKDIGEKIRTDADSGVFDLDSSELVRCQLSVL